MDIRVGGARDLVMYDVVHGRDVEAARRNIGREEDCVWCGFESGGKNVRDGQVRGLVEFLPVEVLQPLALFEL